MTNLPEKLHIWYLEATKELNPKSFNPNAQKKYKDLTEEQRFIDKYIADKIKQSIIQSLRMEEEMFDIGYEKSYNDAVKEFNTKLDSL